ncbi:MAG: DUF4230 domain-containing protein [Clostridia bacterium]|nr:DUF4230 domain-containing protein [Clostridia bacterium]
MEKEKKNNKKKVKTSVVIKMVAIIIAFLIAFGIFAGVHSMILENFSEEEIITVPNLVEIISVSELSTFEAIYNGVATVNNAKNPEKIDYHVAYEGTVKAGIDVEQIEIDIDKENKIIKITKPAVKITNDYVEPESLDFIFVRKKAETETVLGEAYPICQADLKKEIERETAILEIAEENADTIIRGLVLPFIYQFGNEYTLEIN